MSVPVSYTHLLIYVCYVFNTKIRNNLPNWYQKSCFYFQRYGLPSYSGHSSILKKIACKHTTYRLSQSPFFPLSQGGNLRFPVPAGTSRCTSLPSSYIKLIQGAFPHSDTVPTGPHKPLHNVLANLPNYRWIHMGIRPFSMRR